jgi:hypothetical protein
MATKHHDAVIISKRRSVDVERYSNIIPIFVSVRQIDRQGRRAPSIMTSKFAGIPYVVDT